MAIGPDQKVTTTGLMGEKPTMPKAPDLSALGKGQPQQAAPQKPAPIAQRPKPQEPNIESKVAGLPRELLAKVDSFLADPEVNEAMQQIAPENASMIAQFKGNENIVALPEKALAMWAVEKYPRENIQESFMDFITELSEIQSDDTNVPPDMATQTDSMMGEDPNVDQEITPEMEAIDQDQEELA
jgi:hypothetical protein